MSETGADVRLQVAPDKVPSNNVGEASLINVFSTGGKSPGCKPWSFKSMSPGAH